MNRYVVSFLIAISLHLFVILSTFYILNKNDLLTPSQKQNETSRIMVLLHEKKEVTFLPPKLNKDIVLPIRKEIEKKYFPKIEKVTKVDKQIKEVKKIQKVMRTQAKEVTKEPIVYTVIETVVEKILVDNSIQIRNKYYNDIKYTIDKNKVYPRRAIKRGLQGTVTVTFLVSSEGALLSYEIIDGKSIFKKSVIQAIENSFPLTPPAGVFTKNMNFSLSIKYRFY